MKLTCAKAVALTLLVTAGHVVVPAALGVDAQRRGSDLHQRLVAHIRPLRRPDWPTPGPKKGAFGFTRISDSVIRVQVAGRAGVPAQRLRRRAQRDRGQHHRTGLRHRVPSGHATADRFQRQLRRPRSGDGQHGHRQAQRRRRRRRVHAAPDGCRRRCVRRLRAGGLARPGRERPSGDPSRRCVPGARHSAARVRCRCQALSNASMSARPAFPPTRSRSSSTSPRPRPGSASGRRSRSAVSRPNASNLNIDTPGQTRAGQAIVLLSGRTGVQRLHPGRRPPHRRRRRLVHRAHRDTVDRWAVPPGLADPAARLAKHVRHAHLGWQHAGVPGVRPRQPGVRGRSQPHGDRFDDRRLRHSVPLGCRPAAGLEPQCRHVGSDGRQPRHRQGQHSRGQRVHAAGPAHDRRPQRLVPGAAHTCRVATADQPDVRTRHRAGAGHPVHRVVARRSVPGPTSTRSPISALPRRGTVPQSWRLPATSCCSGTAPRTGRRS